MLPCIVIDLFLNNQPDTLIIQLLFCYEILHVRASSLPIIRSFPLCIRHCNFYAGFDDRFQAESGWNILTVLHETYSAECTVENS
jgi:hypothetical protein